MSSKQWHTGRYLYSPGVYCCHSRYVPLQESSSDGILLPVVFQKSPKSQNDALESHAGWKGLCRKAMTLFYVLVGAQLDSLMGTEYVRDAVCIGFICNEALSIIENAGLMGMPLPEILRKSIDALKSEKNA